MADRGYTGTVTLPAALTNRMTRPPTPDLEDHAVIGDCESIAVVSKHGDVDWLCWGRADAPSVFGALLDPDAGHWTIRPDAVRRSHQFYISETNVLITRFETSDGIVEVEDAMAIEGPQRLLRRVRCVRGSAEVTCDAVFRPGYGTEETQTGTTDAGDAAGSACSVRSDSFAAVLRCSTGELSTDGVGRVWSTVSMFEGDHLTFDLVDDRAGPHTDLPHTDDVLDRTIQWWKSWTARGTYRGRYRHVVERSALALKLLTSRSTGGVLAAATTSLPEAVGGPRNWDYRYVWIRDAAFTIYALLEIGHTDEAAAFIGWLIDRVDECDATDDAPLTPLYDLDGNGEIDERELEWQGYEDSRPVRIGNGASGQQQLDIYGELIDSLYLVDHHVHGLALDTWEQIRLIVEHVIDRWREPDAGMWEARSEPRRHTSSILMCWVAVERAIRMAEFRGRPADLERWRTERDAMHRYLVEECWNDDIGAFTQSPGSRDLDGSILLAPLVKFVDGRDPRWLSTLDAIDDRLAHGPLVDRYDTTTYDDGVGGEEGAFTICSFWFVEALARAGRVERAQRCFDQLLGFANPVGLFSEQIGATGRQLGNTPQALTHLALISAAVALDEALDGERPG